MQIVSVYRDAELFWNWFISISKILYQDIRNNAILNELDKRIALLGPYDWEIGPYYSEMGETYQKLYLAISPNLNVELLPITTAIVLQAPKIEGWVLLNSKPKKEYVPFLNMVNEIGQNITIDLSEWKYSLYYFEDGTFDIDLLIGPVSGNKNTINLALDIALTNILGEGKFLSIIKNVRLIEHGLQTEELTNFKNLDSHISHYLNSQT